MAIAKMPNAMPVTVIHISVFRDGCTTTGPLFARGRCLARMDTVVRTIGSRLDGEFLIRSWLQARWVFGLRLRQALASFQLALDRSADQIGALFAGGQDCIHAGHRALGQASGHGFVIDLGSRHRCMIPISGIEADNCSL
ncbi:hypothetical protein [Bosea massiliensis]|uniref:Uncharacterized protein n=1 Tax=Bosea massiliensis TaxID=151419 RepID=A0ABW0NYH1_9HYPH